MKEEPVTTFLDDVTLARIDALARFYRVTRDEMVARIFSTGIVTQERQAREAQARGDGDTR